MKHKYEIFVGDLGLSRCIYCQQLSNAKFKSCYQKHSYVNTLNNYLECFRCLKKIGNIAESWLDEEICPERK